MGGLPLEKQSSRKLLFFPVYILSGSWIGNDPHWRRSLPIQDPFLEKVRVFMTFLNHLINGISLGSVYAIIALGYTMVYGIAKMLNFAHGDVIMVGAYICFFAVASFGLHPILGILLAMVVCTVLGMTIERLAYKPLRQAPSLAVLITAIGMSYLLQNGAQLLWSASNKMFPNFMNFGGKTGIALFGG